MILQVLFYAKLNRDVNWVYKFGGVLPDPFREMGVWRNSTETLGHAPRSGPEIKNGRSSAKDGAPERLRCGTVKEVVSHILQRVSTALQEEFSFRFILHR